MINLQISQMYRAAVAQRLEVQDQSLYSLVTLPAAINPAGGIAFFGDTEAAVGRQRTNLTRSNEVPGRTNYEVHGIGIKFTAAPTVLFSSINDAVRDAYLEFQTNNALRRVFHLSEFFPAAEVSHSFSAAAGDNPFVSHVGTYFVRNIALPVLLLGGVNFSVRIYFTTNVAALGNTVMGVYFEGIIDRGNIKLDQTPVRQMLPEYTS